MIPRGWGRDIPGGGGDRYLRVGKGDSQGWGGAYPGVGGDIPGGWGRHTRGWGRDIPRGGGGTYPELGGGT